MADKHAVMRVWLLITWFVLSFAAFPGAEPADASSPDTHSATIIDVGAHDIMCGEGGGHGPCQWVLALVGSVPPPDLASAAYSSGISRLRILGRAFAPQPPPPRQLS